MSKAATQKQKFSFVKWGELKDNPQEALKIVVHAATLRARYLEEEFIHNKNLSVNDRALVHDQSQDIRYATGIVLYEFVPKSKVKCNE